LGRKLAAAGRISSAIRLAAPAMAPAARKASLMPEHAAGRLIFEGAAYFFCTLACAAEFAQDPERFIG
jgi:YHS domain-containing protein